MSSLLPELRPPSEHLPHRRRRRPIGTASSPRMTRRPHAFLRACFRDSPAVSSLNLAASGITHGPHIIGRDRQLFELHHPQQRFVARCQHRLPDVGCQVDVLALPRVQISPEQVSVAVADDVLEALLRERQLRAFYAHFTRKVVGFPQAGVELDRGQHHLFACIRCASGALVGFLQRTRHLGRGQSDAALHQPKISGVPVRARQCLLDHLRRRGVIVPHPVPE